MQDRYGRKSDEPTIVAAFELLPQYETMLKTIDALAVDGRRLKLSAGGEGLKALALGITLAQAAEVIRHAMPHAICPYRHAKGQSCKTCQDRGWVNKATWDLIPKGDK